MMNEPPKPNNIDEICSMCKRLKNKHTRDELLACMRKLIEFRKHNQGGAGIE